MPTSDTPSRQPHVARSIMFERQKKKVPLWHFLISGSVALCLAIYMLYTPPSAVQWHSGYEAALTEAKRLDRPLLLVFSAWWCPPCREMKQDVWSDSDVGDLANTAYVPVMIDPNREEDLAAQYKVPSIPRILIVSPQEEVLVEESFLYVDELYELLWDFSEQEEEELVLP